jgi:penicillin-binding protein 1B
MEAVIDNGTGSTVRARGFTAPAAGKTGTSHDAWFAGYTSNLLCVVWVGNDDYTDIKLAGGSTAAPIWAEFMKRAQKIPQYSNMKGFPAPAGVVEVQLDKVTNRLSTPACPQSYYVAFIAGTEPKQTCEQAFADHRGFFSKILGLGTTEVAPPPTTNGPVQVPPTGGAAEQDPAAQAAASPPDQQPKKKRGFFSRVFGGKGNEPDQKGNTENSPADKGNKSPPQ